MVDQSCNDLPPKERSIPLGFLSTETERKVAQVFADVLNVQGVSPDDDVFTLGGDSFEAVRVALELEHQFQLVFPVELLEDSTNVRALAAWIDSQLQAKAK